MARLYSIPLMTTPSTYDRLSRETIEYSLARIPGYTAWRARDPGPSASLDRRYASLPVLTKQELRDHFPHGFRKIPFRPRRFPRGSQPAVERVEIEILGVGVPSPRNPPA